MLFYHISYFTIFYYSTCTFRQLLILIFYVFHGQPWLNDARWEWRLDKVVQSNRWANVAPITKEGSARSCRKLSYIQWVIICCVWDYIAADWSGYQYWPTSTLESTNHQNRTMKVACSAGPCLLLYHMDGLVCSSPGTHGTRKIGSWHLSSYYFDMYCLSKHRCKPSTPLHGNNIPWWLCPLSAAYCTHSAEHQWFKSGDLDFKFPQTSVPLRWIHEDPTSQLSGHKQSCKHLGATTKFSLNV